MKEREDEEYAGLDGIDDSSLSLEIQHAIGLGTLLLILSSFFERLTYAFSTHVLMFIHGYYVLATCFFVSYRC